MIEIILGAIVAIFASFFYGKSKGRTEQKNTQEAKDLKGYKETRDELDEVNTPTSGSDAVDWLRDRNKSR